MFEEIDKRFQYLIETAQFNQLSLDIISKAYQKAKELHKDQKRKDGTPYISHPVEVAIILAELNYDENIISAALLHDTIEDCDYTEEDLKHDFNDAIFNFVDCVSAIDKTKYVLDEENIYEDIEFIKASTEEQTFKKLISLGKKNPGGFAVKFADRLHNLRTISTFEYPKQLEKVRETEKWILPIAKALKCEYFYNEIKNECFKIINKKAIEQYLIQYNTYHTSNKKNIENLNIELKESFANSSIKDIKISNKKEFMVFDNLKTLNKNIELAKISQGQIIKVANYNIFMIYKDASFKKALTEVVDILQSKTNIKVIDTNTDEFSNKMYLVVEDNIKNIFKIYVLTEVDYIMFKIGSTNGQNLDIIDEDNINELDTDLIRVKTRSGEIKYIAKGSTALDFAFKIHKDIGFSFKYAIVNNSKTKLPPYTKLNEGDMVEIITEKDENEALKNNARLRWLAYVNTEFAKRALIKYFEKYKWR